MRTLENTMNMECILYIAVLAVQCVLCAGNRLMDFATTDEFMNVCLNGLLHKETPGPESNLFDKCKPWASRSCCTDEVSSGLHVNKTWYNMDWSHCTTPLSDKCRARFVQDLCFYECSPNVGPWLVKVDGMKIRKERFFNVPLCHTECDAWWEDCKDDFTCIENWGREFNWTSGTARCPLGSSCKPFREIYKNSSDFCEKVFDHSWQVVNDTTPSGCFLMWWNEGEDNPNYQIAYHRAKQLVSSSNRVTALFVTQFSVVLVWLCKIVPVW